ncbi:MAG: hypothetical protein GY946_15140 [bacterium]|nr:hypothetical protein [bacterium]
MRALLAGVLIASLTGISGGAAVAGENPLVKDENTAVSAIERDAAIELGLEFLGKHALSQPDAAGTPRKQFTAAVAGLVCLLADDANSKTARKQTRMVDKIRKYLDKYIARVVKRTADPGQLAETSDSFNSNNEMQYTWPLGMAGLFYGELYTRGMRKADAKRTIKSIVAVLEAAQAPNGGWGHAQVRTKGKPRGTSKMDGYGGYPDTLLASSNIVASTLAVLKPIVAPKKDDTLARALAYYEYAELSNGNFPYDPSQRSAHMGMTGVSRAAGAVLALRLLGTDWYDIGVGRALEFIDEHFEYLPEGHGSSTFNLMLAAFLQRMRGQDAWQRFKDAFFQRMIEKQEKTGAFKCICQNKAFGATNDSERGAGGFFANRTDSYVTAIHTLILLLDRAWPKLVPEPPTQGGGDTTSPGG